MKMLNMFISFLMHFCIFSQTGVLQAACNPSKCDVINDIKQFFNSILQDKQPQTSQYDIIQSDAVLQNQAD